MKSVPANDLVVFVDILSEPLDRTHDADMVNQQRNRYGSKRGREEDDQGRRITKKPTKLFGPNGNSEEITQVHRVDISSWKKAQRCGPRRPRSERGAHQPQKCWKFHTFQTPAQTTSNGRRTSQPQLQVVKLAMPFVGTACNKMPFEASSYVDLTLTMETAAGPVKVPGKRRCYVVNDGDECLVSDDTLKTIGIDIDRLLEQVARLEVDDDGGDLEEVELLDAGVIKSNQQSAWCSPVNPLLMPDGRKSLKSADKWSDDDVLKNYRLTNDDCVVNSLAEQKAGTMPFQATILQNLRGKKAMGVFDLPKCF
ncbi:hypothetical protein DYB37_013980 [Aphanomyces astaci]|uniref:Uncharacterized protein n=1 Tax=Aphanomyces astaci TaxID=112090 RepID=A0A3R6Y785_APHAT|nr:hypothetical protein DYB37_013980 [Aphanomyces astaci]